MLDFSSHDFQNKPGIILLGLGPGNPDTLTRKAWEVLSSAQEVYFRTLQHPVVSHLPANLKRFSFDYLYEQSESFEQVYETIITQILELGSRPIGVIYAVPGHPFIAESTAPEIARRARSRGLPVQIIDGVSFLEPAFSALGMDPFPQCTFLDAFEIAALHHPAFPPDVPALIAQVHSQDIAANVKLVLMEVYPDDHHIHLIHAAGTGQQRIEIVPLYELDRSLSIGLLTSVYVPPLPPHSSYQALLEIIARLRAPGGCPWDQKQTISSLRQHLLEEAYEVLAAADQDDRAKLCEELGDLMLVITMMVQIAGEEGDFSIADVLQGINSKLIRRHPHVFEGLELAGVDGVLKNWERLKAQERKENGEDQVAGLLDGVPLALPALTQSKEYQERVTRVGFDWEDISGVYDKIAEEITEVRAAVTPDAQLHEIGDLIFAIVRLASWVNVDAETALRSANQRFKRRFAFLEECARTAQKSLADYSPQELDQLWTVAKQTRG